MLVVEVLIVQTLVVGLVLATVLIVIVRIADEFARLRPLSLDFVRRARLIDQRREQPLGQSHVAESRVEFGVEMVVRFEHES